VQTSRSNAAHACRFRHANSPAPNVTMQPSHLTARDTWTTPMLSDPQSIVPTPDPKCTPLNCSSCPAQSDGRLASEQQAALRPERHHPSVTATDSWKGQRGTSHGLRHGLCLAGGEK